MNKTDRSHLCDALFKQVLAFKAIMQHPRSHNITAQQLAELLNWVRVNNTAVEKVIMGYQFPQCYTDNWLSINAQALPLATKTSQFIGACLSRQNTRDEAFKALWLYFIINALTSFLNLMQFAHGRIPFVVFAYLHHSLPTRIRNTQMQLPVPITTQRASCTSLVNKLNDPSLSAESVAQNLIDADNAYSQEADQRDDYISRLRFCLFKVRGVQYQQAQISLNNGPQ